MKKLITALLVSLALSGPAFAAANDVLISQRNATDTATLTRFLPFPAASGNGVLVFDGSATLPKAATLGGGIVYNGTTLTTSNIPLANVSGLQTALDDLENAIDALGSAGVTSFNGRTGTVIPMANDYAVADIDGLTTALSGKANSVHTHAASDVTSGTFADGRISQSNVTQHEGALSIATTQVTGTKTNSFISDFVEAAQDAVGAMISSQFVYNDGANSLSLRSPSYTNNASRTIQTVAGAANGWQLSSTRDATVRYSVTINSTVSLAGNQTGYVVIEVAATNSSTAGDWQEVGRVASGQSGALVIGLTLNQVGGGQLNADVPAGYYVRIRSVNTAGTPTYTYNSGQEKLI